jgi:hypothetical protein
LTRHPEYDPLQSAVTISSKGQTQGDLGTQSHGTGSAVSRVAEKKGPDHNSVTPFFGLEEGRFYLTQVFNSSI